MRLLVGLLLAAVPFVAFAEEPRTTRIETRPYYGAVVTIEHGVRVYRPVPPTTHMSINPDGITPLELDVGGQSPSRAGSQASLRPMR